MSSINKVILVGRVGKDPEIKQFQNGNRIASFSLATSENWKDKQTGERKERTEWHNVTINGDGLVRVVERFVSRGSKLYIEGKLQTRKWQDQSGNDRYTTEVVVSGFTGTLTLLDGKSESRGSADDYNPSAPRGSAKPSQSFDEDFGDDLPF